MNLSRLSRWILFAAGLLILSPHLRAQGLSEAAHHVKTASPDLAIVHLEKDIPDLMSQADVPGLSIAVLRNGRTAWLHNFGIKNTKTKEAVTDDTIFEAASLSKPVFAYAVLKLVDQGKVGLDVPLSTYLPKPYIESDDRLAKITARIVLSHRPDSATGAVTAIPSPSTSHPANASATPVKALFTCSASSSKSKANR
jgi:CubicO group peptidase (beta-lactamase class C family)